MFDLFLQDARRWVIQGQLNPSAELNLRRVLVLLYQHMPLRALAWFRFGSWCKQNGIRFLPGFSQRQIYARYGLEIVIGSDIDGGLYIAHPIGTVIAAKHIGKNCSVIAAVTIGMRNEWEFPNIGDGVFIGSGARVLGGITIGDNAIIGANAVVINDIPAGATAVGIPAKILGSKAISVELQL